MNKQTRWIPSPLRLLADRRRLLVVDLEDSTDGTHLRASVVRRAAKQVVIEGVVESKAAEFEAALADVLRQLRHQSYQVPRRAVLLAPQVVGAVLQLPVDPHSARQTAEMKEMVCWELEPQLVIQGPWPADGQDEECCYGWSPGAPRSETSVSFDNGEVLFEWLACGVSRRLREGWSAAFVNQGLKLEGLYPRVFPEEGEPSSFAGHGDEIENRLLGAANHALGLQNRQQAVCVPARDPRPPYWRRSWIWCSAACGVAVLLVGLLESSLSTQMRAAVAQNALVESELKNATASAASVRDCLAEAQRLEPAVAEQRQLLAEVIEIRELIDSELPTSNHLLPDLLDALADAASEDIVLERVVKTDGTEIEIVAWSISEVAAQEFARALAGHQRLRHLEVADVMVQPEKGRLGLEGHLLQLRLIQTRTPPGTPTLLAKKAE